MNRARMRILAAATAVTLAAPLLLAACGHKGPLYLPDESKQQQNKDKQGGRY